MWCVIPSEATRGSTAEGTWSGGARGLGAGSSPHFSVCRAKARVFSGVRVPAGQLSLLPVAIGAVVEVTKQPKPSVQRVALGDLASVQAVTRVNAEQASTRAIREPTRLRFGEG